MTPCRRRSGRRGSSRVLVAGVAVLACVTGLVACKSEPKGKDSTASVARPTLPAELDFALPTIDGRTLHLADALVQGPVILDFWATWCAPCKIAMPAYSALADRYAEHGVQLWAVSWDHPRMHDRIAPYFERAGFTFPALLDAEKEVGRGLGVVNLPTTFLIAPDGTIAWRHIGFAAGDELDLEKALRTVLTLD